MCWFVPINIEQKDIIELFSADTHRAQTAGCNAYIAFPVIFFNFRVYPISYAVSAFGWSLFYFIMILLCENIGLGGLVSSRSTGVRQPAVGWWVSRDRRRPMIVEHMVHHVLAVTCSLASRLETDDVSNL